MTEQERKRALRLLARIRNAAFEAGRQTARFGDPDPHIIKADAAADELRRLLEEST